MHKRLVAGLGLVGLLVAGCGEGGVLSTPEETSSPTSAPPPTSETKSQRSAPAKAVSIPDKCSIITESQQQELDVEQPPEEFSSNGHIGCRYKNGELGGVGWQMFVAVNGDKKYADEVKIRPNPTKETEVSGYPVTAYKSGVGCVLYADVSDEGLLIANTTQSGTEDPGVDLCQRGEKFIEAAVKNLPDA